MTATFEFRVAWFDCDPAGIVFYPRVLAYMNEAAHALLEAKGFSLATLSARGVIGVPMVSLTIDYVKVLKLGDFAVVESEITGIGRTSIKFVHRVLSGGEESARAAEVRVYAKKDETGAVRAAAVDEDVRAALLAGGGAP